MITTVAPVSFVAIALLICIVVLQPKEKISSNDIISLLQYLSIIKIKIESSVEKDYIKWSEMCDALEVELNRRNILEINNKNNNKKSEKNMENIMPFENENKKKDIFLTSKIVPIELNFFRDSHPLFPQNDYSLL